LHAWFTAQTTPHAPQLLRSNMVLRQTPLQRVSPVLQVQLPLMQPSVDGVPPHWLPQAPQFCRLVSVLMQMR
jgi:hypothetical protein